VGDDGMPGNSTESPRAAHFVDRLGASRKSPLYQPAAAPAAYVRSRPTFRCVEATRRASYAAVEKLATAAASSSWVSNTETSLVIVKRSCSRFVTRITFKVPPDILVVAYARMRSPSPAVSIYGTFPRSTTTRV
jgi:hypothetical protein